MRKLLVIALVLGLVGVAAAYDLGSKMPAKATPVIPENVPSGDRQGGEDVFSATVIPALPYSDSGTTTGHYDDYDEICPYSGSTSPDVVYSFNVTQPNFFVNVDLCGSAYDTKTYIYDANFNLVACNDDYWYDSTCGYYPSFIEEAIVPVGQIYIVVDGYYGAYGNYVINVTGGVYVPCELPCPPGGVAEGEPAMPDNYSDDYNGGCNSGAPYPFQHVFGDGSGNAILCGVSGWYFFNGASYRDTDWFTLTCGMAGAIEVTADAEYLSYIFELSGDCINGVSVVQSALIGDCAPASLTIPGAYMATKWFWVGPSDWSMGDDYDYIVWFSGLYPEGVATQPETWGTVKALFE